MSEWQTIDTAPQDGTEVLLYCPQEPGDDEPVTLGLFERGEWCALQEHWPQLFPTHWMPKPEPPK